MSFAVAHHPLAETKADAVVGVIRTGLFGSSKVDPALLRIAGPELQDAYRRQGPCPVGEARITEAFRLPCRHVIHTAAPVWKGGDHGEKKALRSCYLSCFALAEKNGCRSIALPVIVPVGGGVSEASSACLARSAAAEYLRNHTLEITLICDPSVYELPDKQAVKALRDWLIRAEKSTGHGPAVSDKTGQFRPITAPAAPIDPGLDLEPMMNLDAYLDNREENFSDKLMKILDEKGIKKNSECYEPFPGRQVFSKVRNGGRPSKLSVLGFAINLKLNIVETEGLLSTAGYALSRSDRFDLVIRYVIEIDHYHTFNCLAKVDDALYEMGLPTFISPD